MVDDHALELHAQLHDGREVLDTIERDLRDVQQPRHATDLHKRSVRFDGLDVSIETDGRDGGWTKKGTCHNASVDISSEAHSKTKTGVLVTRHLPRMRARFHMRGRRSVCTAKRSGRFYVGPTARRNHPRCLCLGPVFALCINYKRVYDTLAICSLPILFSHPSTTSPRESSFISCSSTARRLDTTSLLFSADTLRTNASKNSAETCS